MGKTEKILPGWSLPDRPSAFQGQNGRVARKSIAAYSLLGSGLVMASLLAGGAFAETERIGEQDHAYQNSLGR